MCIMDGRTPMPMPIRIFGTTAILVALSAKAPALAETTLHVSQINDLRSRIQLLGGRG